VSNLSNVSDKRLMTSFHRVVGALADRFGNDIEQGAAPTLYCISEPIPPGSYVGVDGRLGLSGGPVLIGRSPLACDYEVAAKMLNSPRTKPAQRFPCDYLGVAKIATASPPTDTPADPPIASITEMAFCAQNRGPIASSDGAREDRPTPRWSSRITRLNDASRQ